jgi:hypothetical protein
MTMRAGINPISEKDAKSRWRSGVQPYVLFNGLSHRKSKIKAVDTVGLFKSQKRGAARGRFNNNHIRPSLFL